MPLVLPQNTPIFMSGFKETKSINMKLTQGHLVGELVFFDSTLKPYRKDIKLKSPFRYSEIKNGFKRSQRLQKTSSELPIESVNPIKPNKAKGGFLIGSSRSNSIERVFSFRQESKHTNSVLSDPMIGRTLRNS